MYKLLKTIEKMPKGQQVNVLLELLEELGGSVQVRRNQLSQYWVERMAVQLEKERRQCEIIKAKIKQLYNENIQDGIPVQNIAQP